MYVTGPVVYQEKLKSERVKMDFKMRLKITEMSLVYLNIIVALDLY